TRFVPVSDARFFFFQAEDGIRDLIVTGVQTCALPISFAERTAARISASYPARRTSHRPGGVVRGDILQRLEYPRQSSHYSEAVEIGGASCRERVYKSVVAVSMNEKCRGCSSGWLPGIG